MYRFGQEKKKILVMQIEAIFIIGKVANDLCHFMAFYRSSAGV